VIFICQIYAARAFSEPIILIELFAWSSPLVVTVTRNGPHVGVTITSEFVVVPGTKKNQSMHRRMAAETEYVTIGRRFNKEKILG